MKNPSLPYYILGWTFVALSVAAIFKAIYWLHFFTFLRMHDKAHTLGG